MLADGLCNVSVSICIIKGMLVDNCVVNGMCKGVGSGTSKRLAKEESARQAYRWDGLKYAGKTPYVLFLTSKRPLNG
jgi:hypothetical protein